MSRTNIHATGLVLDGTGVMLRGPSASGKSLLALELLNTWEDTGRIGRLVGDDRLEIEVIGSRLEMHGPAAISGLIELRGRGVVSRPYLPSSPVHLVVDLVGTFERMIEEHDLLTEVAGVTIPRCPVPRAGIIDSRHQLLLIREAMRALGSLQSAAKKPLESQNPRGDASVSP